MVVITEKIRLVIWDLDETFWRGTLTEGGIEYIQANHDIVVELARRGIVSSICSKNNHDVIESLLKEKGLWEYFVFPSIDWTAKGPRLAALVEASQLRAPTVLFIDDNPMNLAEAQRFVEGIQIGDPSVINDMLANPLFKGKDDHDLIRLQQYKLLERRAGEMAQAAAPLDFLRESDIRVIIDYDIEANIDRAIELINRTNQLNFTKKRLPEDIEEARSALRRLLNNSFNVFGLVRVIDRYGDYGFVGFYAMNIFVDSPAKLLHYCFSCRTLGMQVETWLYPKLGRPEIAIQGEVVTDILVDIQIDWIRQVEAATTNASHTAGKVLSRIVLRGGCELSATTHYFSMLTECVIDEVAFSRDGIRIRPDSPDMLRLALDRPSQPMLDSLAKLGYQPNDFDTALTQHDSQISQGGEIWIISIWGGIPHSYRHRYLNFRVPVDLKMLFDKRIERPDQLSSVDTTILSARAVLAAHELLNNYEYVRGSTRDNAIQIARVLQRLPRSAHAFLLCPSEKRSTSDGSLVTYQHGVELSDWIRSVATMFNNVSVLSLDDYILDASERMQDGAHFGRIVYFRLFEDIRDRINGLDFDLTKINRDQGRKFNGTSSRTWIIRGELALIDKDFDGAEKAFAEAVKLGSTEFSAFSGLSIACQQRAAVGGNGAPNSIDSFRLRLNADHPALHVKAAVLDHGVLKIRGGTGCAFFGPYIDLPAGWYSVSIVLSGPTSGRAKMDLAVRSMGLTVRGKQLIECAFDLSRKEGSCLVLSAHLPEPVFGFEVRLWIEEDTQANVAAVEIELIGTRPPKAVPEARCGLSVPVTA